MNRTSVLLSGLSVVAALAVSVMTAGCASKQVRRTGQPPPEWVVKTPMEEGAVCAVGTAGPTRILSDGKEYAAESGRAGLSHTLGTRVYSLMLDTQTMRGTNTESQAVVQATAFASDVVLIGSTVRSYWMDESGEYSGGTARTHYSLVCMPLDPGQITAFLGKLVQETAQDGALSQDSQAVRARAAAAFDELEAEEAKHQ